MLTCLTALVVALYTSQRTYSCLRRWSTS